MEHTNKYFGTDGIRGRVGDSVINSEFVLKLGWAVGMVLGRANDGEILIGKDTRISGYMLESALEAGLSAAGANIRLLGPMPTPAIAYLTRTFRAQAGIVISASHNLYYDNGIKFFSIHGTKVSVAVEQAIELQMEKPLVTVDSAKLGKAARVVDAAGRYIEFCKSTFPNHLNLAGMKIVVDCAQGATYRVAPPVFRELGAKVITMGTQPDGLNINKNCGSTDTGPLRKKVLSEEAHLGIAFDGDGDRVIMIDNKGELVDGDELLFIIARDAKRKGTLSGGVVGTIMSNFGFERAMKKLSIDFIRAPVGDRYVMEHLKKAGWILGGEPSGHIVNLGLTTTGDGIISALQILRAISETGQGLSELKAGMKKMPQVLVNVGAEKPALLVQNADIQSAVASTNKKLGKSGRLLLRASGTEPLVRVMVEGEDLKEVDFLANELAEVVRKIGKTI